jgi:hypothetical protein
MRNERTPAEQDRDDDVEVLGWLTDDEDQRPWSKAELDREVGDENRVHDALVRLVGAGLVHRCGEFVFATRPAVYFARLEP